MPAIANPNGTRPFEAPTEVVRRMSGSSWNFGGGLHGLTVTQ